MSPLSSPSSEGEFGEIEVHTEDGARVFMSAPPGDLEDQDAPPSIKKFKKLSKYKSCVVPVDEGDVNIKYWVDEDVHVVPAAQEIGKSRPEKLGLGDVWRGRIKSIRSGDPEQVWVDVAWYYSPKEFKAALDNLNKAKGQEKITDFHVSECGKRELIATDHRDIVSSFTLNGQTEVYGYRDRDWRQQQIPADAYYTRTEFFFKKRTFEDKPQGDPCTLCDKRYNPDKDIMHFCPRAKCHKWFHTTCLKKANWLEKTMTVDEIAAAYEAGVETDMFDHFDTAPPPMKRRRKGPPGVRESSYDDIPAELLALARRPIIKGGDYGLVGNMNVVLRARWVVVSVVRQGALMPENWVEYVWHKEQRVLPEFVLKTDKKKKAVAFKCPTCGIAI